MALTPLPAAPARPLRALEPSPRYGRTVVILGLAAATALSWIGTVWLVTGMHPGHPDTRLGVVPVFLMWFLMMAAMMIPAAAPNLLAVAAADGDMGWRRCELVRAVLFLSGDLSVWIVFSGIAALAQRSLHAAALLGPRMASTSGILSGALLLAAGLFQFTPFKKACLRRCRVPFDRSVSGPRNAFLAGLEHGAFSAGSCAALMLVLFVTGVMSLPWMAVLTVFLVVEKVVLERPWISHLAGAALAAWGAWMLVGALA